MLLLVVAVSLFLGVQRLSETTCRNRMAKQVVEGGNIDDICKDQSVAKYSHLALMAVFRDGGPKAALAESAHMDSRVMDHPLSVKVLGESLLQVGKYEEAITFWHKRRNYEGLYDAAERLFVRGQYQVSKTFVDARLALGNLRPEDWKVFWLAIQLELEISGNIDRVLELVQEGASLNPQAWFLYSRTGRLLWESGRLTDSNRVYEEGSRRFPGKAEMWIGLGRNALGAQEVSNMCHYFETALHLRHSSFACEVVFKSCPSQTRRSVEKRCGD